jgi:hypothetical protein
VASRVLGAPQEPEPGLGDGHNDDDDGSCPLGDDKDDPAGTAEGYVAWGLIKVPLISSAITSRRKTKDRLTRV